MNIKAAVVVGVLTAFAGAVQAASVDNYAFGGLGNLGTSTHTFAPVGGSGPNITASGFQMSSGPLAAVDLYSKGSGTFPPPNDESGLGLTNDPTGDHEITPENFIMLDLSNLSLSSIGIYMGSTTNPDAWKIWGSNTAAQVGNSFSIPGSGTITGTTEGNQNVSSLDGDRYIFVTATNGNVLLGGLTATSAVPEPASAGLLGLALLGSGLLFRKRLIKKA